MAFSNTKTEAG